MRVAVPANVQRTIWSPKWSSTRDHGPALPGRIGTRRQISRYKSILNRTEQNGPGSSATLHQIVCGAICAPPEASTLRLWNQCDERVRYHRSQDRVPGPGTNCAMNRASGVEHGGGIASDVSSPTRAAVGRVPSVQRPALFPGRCELRWTGIVAATGILQRGGRTRSPAWVSSPVCSGSSRTI